MKRLPYFLLLLLILVALFGTYSVQAGNQALGDTVSRLPIIVNKVNPVQASKIAYIVHGRAAAVSAAMRTVADPAGTLAADVTTSLSDNLIQVNSAGQLRLTIHSQQSLTQSQLNDLAALGGVVEMTTADIVWPAGVEMPSGLNMMVVWVPYNRLTELEKLQWLAAVTTVEDQAPDEGTFLSEGVALHNADDLDALGIDGTGINIGAISDGVDNLAVAQGTNDLPATVTIPGCTAGSGDEGTAMLEIIHDMAPAAGLFFCGTGGGVANHVNAQNSLVAAGVNVIAEDIPFDSEPAFQQGLAAVNGDNIAAAGVSMHSSSGNRGAQHTARVAATGTGNGPDGNNGPFAGCANPPDNVVAIAPSGDTTFDLQVQPGNNGTNLSITLQWSEPRAIFPTAGAGGFTDLNLYVMDAGLTTCLASSAGVQGNGAGDTIEQISIPFAANGPNVNVKIVVDVQAVNGAVATPTIDLRWRGSTTNFDASTRNGSLNPDANYTGLATSAGAVNAGNSTNLTTVAIEGFSSGGPVQLGLTTVCNGGAYPCPGDSVAGPALTTSNAPTWTAADGVDVSGAGSFGSGTCPAVNPGDCSFFGTSAAAPHAAACDVLVRQNLGAAATVAAVNARLSSSAVDRGAPGFDTVWGIGVLDCLQAAIQADLALTKNATPDPVAAGTQLTYQLEVTNNGPDDMPEVVITDTLPNGVTFNNSPDGCVETVPGSGVVTCSAGTVVDGATASFTIVVDVDADLVYNNGGPVTITNEATVGGIGFELNAADNDTSVDTLVVAEADLAILDFTAVDTPSEILIGETTTLTFTKTVQNNGPSTPIDGELTLTATPPAGSLVTPTMTTISVTGLELGVPRLVTETFTINCGQPGAQTFTFNNEIQPLNAADSDPNQANNSAAVDVVVECVIPVAINIKPGSLPNSINLKNEGVIPLAVLTTLAGEYDLPLDFDATAIDPLSVLFGRPDDVWAEIGGTEAHDKGHIEDAYELDEQTKDGDLDMVLHFWTQETGLLAEDTMACVKGEWVSDGGDTFKFFGCDSIRIVPPAHP